MHCALAIMARTPKLHATKTRLQAELGAAGALRAHIQLVEDTLGRLAGLQGVAVTVWVTELDDTVRGWGEQTGWPLCLQPQGDLGTRMHTILCSLFSRGADRACLIGTDCPQIDAAYLEAAWAALSTADVVIGPAEDGGYGLIGMQAPQPELFVDVPWGSADVLSETLAHAQTAGLCVRRLATIWDVDTPADWRRYQRWSERHSSRSS